ncbi:MAG: hypothetical protein WCR96_01975, partial [Candidatus Methanomethylophilaceae archaeon]
MPQDILSNISLKGQDLAGASKILENGAVREFWAKLSASEKKGVLKGSNLGVGEINKLVKALNSAAKAMEEYTGKIDKYESSFKKLTNAYKEGRKETKLYLEEALKSGGKLALMGASVSLLTNEIKKNIDAMQDYVNSVRRYDIEQEKFSRASLIQKKSLDNMRWSLSLTKNEMVSFFEELKRGESLGFSTKQIEQSFLKIKSVYGNDAMKMFGSYQDILSKMPNVSNQIKGKGFQGFDKADVFNLLENRQFGTMLQLRSGGMFGGEVEKSKAADIENVQKLVDSFGEYAKDEASRYFMPSLSLASKTLGGINSLVDYTSKILLIVGMIAAIRGTGSVGNLLKGIGGGNLAAGAKAVGKRALNIGKGAFSLGGLELGGAVLTGLVGGQVLGAGVSKAFGGNSYNPKELYSALTSGPDALKSFGKGLFSGYGQFYSEDKGEGLKERISGTVDPYRYSKGSSGRITRMTKGGQESLLTIGREMEAIYNQTEIISSMWTDYYGHIKNLADIDSEIASKAGNMVEFKEASLDKQKSMDEEYKKMVGLYEEERKTVLSKIEEMKKIAGYEGSKEYMAAESTLSKIDKKLAEADKALIDGRISILDQIIQEQLTQGGAGTVGTTKIKMARALAKAAFSRSRYLGGEFQAAGGLRKENISEAQNELQGVEKAMTEARKVSVSGKTYEERLAAEKSLVDLEEKRTDAEEKLKEAMVDVKDLEILSKDIEIYLKGLSAQQNYVESINGSFQALKPFWEAEVETKKRLAEIAKSDMQRMASKHEKGSQEYKEKEAEYAIRSLDAKKAELELAKKVRDQKKEEISFASDWMREQADFLEEMGGGFSEILSLRSRAIEKERQSISVQQDFINTGVKSGTLEGFELIKAQTDLERMKMKMTRDTIGIQKSA